MLAPTLFTMNSKLNLREGNNDFKYVVAKFSLSFSSLINSYHHAVCKGVWGYCSYQYNGWFKLWTLCATRSQIRPQCVLGVFAPVHFWLDYSGRVLILHVNSLIEKHQQEWWRAIVEGIDHLPVPLLHLLHQLISGKLPSDHHDQVLNDVLGTVYIQQATYHHW